MYYCQLLYPIIRQIITLFAIVIGSMFICYNAVEDVPNIYKCHNAMPITKMYKKSYHLAGQMIALKHIKF